MNEFWQHCLSLFAKELGQQQFVTWIQPLQCAVAGSQVTITAPNGFVQRWVRDRFHARILEIARDQLGSEATVQLMLAERGTITPAVNATAPAIHTAKPAPPVRDISRLNPGFTFDTFVTGKANDLARAAARQVAEKPGAAYNPLFVYGGVGLGKTHLIHAIGNHLRARAPESKIRYIHAEQYVSDVVRAYQHKAFDDFKRYYHSLDLLLIDDIQFFSGKNRTQEEFFYAFNA
jgi:chromosomal replication initiator protein